MFKEIKDGIGKKMSKEQRLYKMPRQIQKKKKKEHQEIFKKYVTLKLVLQCLVKQKTQLKREKVYPKMDLKKFSKTCKKREADRKMERQRIRRSHNYLIGFPGGEKGKKKKS